MVSVARLPIVSRPRLVPTLWQLPPQLRSTYSIAIHHSQTLRSRSASTLHLPPILASLTLPQLPSLRDFLSEIWNGILLAVPKKKPSKSQSKKRRNTGKGLRDVENLGRCSSCGRIKRLHLLCPYCVQNIQDLNKGDSNLLDVRERLKEEQDDPMARQDERRLRDIRKTLPFLKSPSKLVTEDFRPTAPTTKASVSAKDDTATQIPRESTGNAGIPLEGVQ